MTPLAVGAKCATGNVGLVRVDRNKVNLGLGDEKVEIAHTIRDRIGLR